MHTLVNDKATDPAIPLENVDTVRECIRCLYPDEKQLLRDHFGEDATYREIAAPLGVHFSRVNQRLVQIKKRVRRWILKKEMEF